MRRAIACLVVSFLSAHAVAQIDIISPVVGDREVAGLETVVSIDIPPGLGPGPAMTDGESIEVLFDLIDINDQALFGPFSVSIIDGPFNYVNAIGNSINVDLGQSLLQGAVMFPGVAGIRVKCRTFSGAPSEFVQTPFDALDESIDETLEIVLPDSRPLLVSAFVSVKAETLTLIFSESLTNFDIANDINHTVPADVDNLDFQFSPIPVFTGAEPPVTGISNARFEKMNPTRLIFDIDTLNSNLMNGGYLRPTYQDADETPAESMSVRDIVGYAALPDAIRISGLSTNRADLNEDGSVDAEDLAILLAAWGPVP